MLHYHFNVDAHIGCVSCAARSIPVMCHYYIMCYHQIHASSVALIMCSLQFISPSLSPCDVAFPVSSHAFAPVLAGILMCNRCVKGGRICGSVIYLHDGVQESNVIKGKGIFIHYHGSIGPGPQ